MKTGNRIIVLGGLLPEQKDAILAAVKWLERIHDRKEMLPASFLDNTGPLPIAKKLREMLKP